MGEESTDPATGALVETALRDALARDDRALASVVPVLRHLLAGEGQRLVSDAILARVRGMLGDLASQILVAGDRREAALRRADGEVDAECDALAGRLAADAALLAFCHALAAESLLAERLHQRHAIDPVLSPLFQELIASDEPAVAELAMSALAAQSRFIQSQRRMELPLSELPAELFHRVARLGQAGAIAELQRDYDEAVSRIGLLARLAATMRRGAVAALALEHAGAALFASALAALVGMPRVDAVLACQEGQGARLALLLRAADIDAEPIARQLSLVDPAAHPPRGIGAITPGRARQMLVEGAV